MKNGKPIDWETRLEKLEADVKDIKAMPQAQQKPEEPWWHSVVGSMPAGDPACDAVSKIVSELREKERREARRRKPVRQKS
jgi:hypothetical protein